VPSPASLKSRVSWIPAEPHWNKRGLDNSG